MTKKKLLFVAEAVTLAHVARPLVLSSALRRKEYDIDFACDPRAQWLLANFSGRYFPLPSIASGDFLTALARGVPVYDEATLNRYVQDDIKLLEQAKPDAVIGDFRLSLSISARLTGIPYLAVSNCYWSPYWKPRRYTVPSHVLTRVLPLPIADALFQLARPVAFVLHCRPLNRVRRSYGLPALGSDLRRVYTDADHVLYADLPELFPDADLPAHHHFIGPLTWSPPVPVPEWWDTIRRDRPIVYVTLGSSGQAELLPGILHSLAALDITVIAATAGGKLPDTVPTYAHVARYLPGNEAARRASLVICNGGSPTCQQALAAGVPVIGVASNMDQFLNMDAVVRAGAGAIMRADRFSGPALAVRARELLSVTKYALAAQNLAAAISRRDGGTAFCEIVRRVTGDVPPRAEKMAAATINAASI